MNTNEAIIYASVFSVAAPLYLYVVSTISSPPRYVHIIGVLVCISAASDAMNIIFDGNTIIVPHVINLYYILLFIMLSWFYYELFIKKSYNQNYKAILLIGSITYALCLVFTLVLLAMVQYQTSLWILSGSFIIIYSISFLHYLYKAGAGAPPALHCSLWFVSGIILYFVISTGIFLLFQYFLTKTEPDLVRTVWSVHNVGNILKNLLFAAGFYFSMKLK